MIVSFTMSGIFFQTWMKQISWRFLNLFIFFNFWDPYFSWRFPLILCSVLGFFSLVYVWWVLLLMTKEATPKPMDHNIKEQKNYGHGNNFSVENHKRNKTSFAWRSFRNETSQFPFWECRGWYPWQIDVSGLLHKLNSVKEIENRIQRLTLKLNT